MFGVHDTNAGTATVYLPEKAYKKISLSIGAGTAVSEMTLQAEKVELEVGMGTLETAVDASKKLTVDVGMGEADLIVAGSETDFDTDISVGAGSVECGSHDFSGLSQEYTTDKGSRKEAGDRLWHGKCQCGFPQIVAGNQFGAYAPDIIICIMNE